MRRKTAKASNPEHLCEVVKHCQCSKPIHNLIQGMFSRQLREDGQHSEVLKFFVFSFILNIHLNLFSNHNTKCKPLDCSFELWFSNM